MHRLVISRPPKTRENYLNRLLTLKTLGYQTSKTQDLDSMRRLTRKLSDNSMLKETQVRSSLECQIAKMRKKHKSIIQAQVITQVCLPKQLEPSVQTTQQLMNRALVKAQLPINSIAQLIALIIGETM